MVSSKCFCGLVRQKEGSFVVLLAQLLSFSRVSRVSRLSKVRVGIRVSVRIRVSLVLVTWWGQDFPTCSEWGYM